MNPLKILKYLVCSFIKYKNKYNEKLKRFKEKVDCNLNNLSESDDIILREGVDGFEVNGINLVGFGIELLGVGFFFFI